MDTSTSFPSLAWGTEYRTAERSQPPMKDMFPVRDARYPAYAGVMSDGRQVTDYRPQCSKNVAPHAQFHTKRWMIQHADHLMEEARRRQVEWSGASLPMANTVPPPARVVHSTPFSSVATNTNLKHGHGVERADAQAPPLFGTFFYEPTMSEIQNNRKNIHGTTIQEGGRNSKRGT